MNNFNFIQPADITEAVQKCTTTPASDYIAGGTNIIDLWKYNLTGFTSLIDINHVGNTAPAQVLPDGSVRIHAFATNAATAYDPLIEERYPLLSRAILAGASAQIRNMATNGGNLLQRTRCYYFYDPSTPCNKRSPGSGCSAIHGYNRIHAILGASENCIAVFPSDMCVALAALNAIVNVTGLAGNRVIDFADFHCLPGASPEIDNILEHGEIITSIDLPPDNFRQHYSYLKLRDRNSYAFALVSVATAFQLENNLITHARIALGGVAHKPWRVIAAEKFLEGKTPTAENFGAAADLLLAGAIGYTHNSFKIPLARKAVIRNCMMALDPSVQLPGAQPSV